MPIRSRARSSVEGVACVTEKRAVGGHAERYPHATAPDKGNSSTTTTSLARASETRSSVEKPSGIVTVSATARVAFVDVRATFAELVGESARIGARRSERERAVARGDLGGRARGREPAAREEHGLLRREPERRREREAAGEERPAASLARLHEAPRERRASPSGRPGVKSSTRRVSAPVAIAAHKSAARLTRVGASPSRVRASSSSCIARIASRARRALSLRPSPASRAFSVARSSAVQRAGTATSSGAEANAPLRAPSRGSRPLTRSEPAVTSRSPHAGLEERARRSHDRHVRSPSSRTMTFSRAGPWSSMRTASAKSSGEGWVTTPLYVAHAQSLAG